MSNQDEIDALISAANAWANALDVVAEAEKSRKPAGDELDRIEAAEIKLYAAVLDWRNSNPYFRN